MVTVNKRFKKKRRSLFRKDKMTLLWEQSPADIRVILHAQNINTNVMQQACKATFIPAVSKVRVVLDDVFTIQP